MVGLAVMCSGGDVVRSDAETWRFGTHGVEYVSEEVRQKARGDVVGVVGVSAWLAAQSRNVAAEISAVGISREVEEEEFTLERKKWQGRRRES